MRSAMRIASSTSPHYYLPFRAHARTHIYTHVPHVTSSMYRNVTTSQKQYPLSLPIPISPHEIVLLEKRKFRAYPTTFVRGTDAVYGISPYLSRIFFFFFVSFALSPRERGEGPRSRT